jgi:hypothetical protein
MAPSFRFQVPKVPTGTRTTHPPPQIHMHHGSSPSALPTRPSPIHSNARDTAINEVLERIANYVAGAERSNTALTNVISNLAEEVKSLGTKLDHIDPSLHGIRKDFCEHTAVIKDLTAQGQANFEMVLSTVGDMGKELSKVQSDLTAASSSLRELSVAYRQQMDSDDHTAATAFYKYSGNYMSQVLEIALGNMTALGKGPSESIERTRTQAKINLYEFQQQLSHASSSMTEAQIASYLQEGYEEAHNSADHLPRK